MGVQQKPSGAKRVPKVSQRVTKIMKESIFGKVRGKKAKMVCNFIKCWYKTNIQKSMRIFAHFWDGRGWPEYARGGIPDPLISSAVLELTEAPYTLRLAGRSIGGWVTREDVLSVGVRSALFGILRFG
jgi:hypothetical protein